MKTKLLFGILIATFLVLGVAGPGHAQTFAQGELIRVAYDAATGMEEGTDLGSLSTILSTGAQTLGAGANAVSLSDLNETKWSNVNVAYFAFVNGLDYSPSAYAAVSSTATSVTNGVNSWSGIVTQGNEVSNYYAGTVGGTASKAVVTTTGTVGGGSGSYYNLMDDYGNVASQVGTFYNWITSQTGETNAGNPQIQNLFQWVGNTTHTSKSGHNTLEGLDASFAGTLLGTLQVEFDGSNNLYTLFTPEGAPTPIPPGVLLLAPGLFGLIGWRRKMWHS